MSAWIAFICLFILKVKIFALNEKNGAFYSHETEEKSPIIAFFLEKKNDQDHKQIRENWIRDSQGNNLSYSRIAYSEGKLSSYTLHQNQLEETVRFTYAPNHSIFYHSTPDEEVAYLIETNNEPILAEELPDFIKKNIKKINQQGFITKEIFIPLSGEITEFNITLDNINDKNKIYTFLAKPTRFLKRLALNNFEINFEEKNKNLIHTLTKARFGFFNLRGSKWVPVDGVLKIEPDSEKTPNEDFIQESL